MRFGRRRSSLAAESVHTEPEPRRRNRLSKPPTANATKIVFIGAGSMSFGLSMFRDIFFAEMLRGSTLTLVDANPESLA